MFRSRTRAPARVPDGARVYAVGDVHGRLDLFNALVERIGRDHADRPGPAAHIVLLGDYVDRGPKSAQLLDRLADGPPPWTTWTVLRGNHEQSLIDLLAPGSSATRLTDWLEYGGRETLRSYGVPSALAYGDDMGAILGQLALAVPQRHRQMLVAMPLTYRAGDYFFAHAGIRPGVTLELQQDQDLLWIRDPFLRSRADHGVVVVHGHSVTAAADERANRIGIDTGAYATGRLTAVVLEGETRRFLSTLG